MKQSARIRGAARYASQSIKPRGGYVCFQCRQKAFLFSQRAPRLPQLTCLQKRNSSSLSNESAFTRNLRKKIWGKNDPGPQEPEPEAELATLDEIDDASLPLDDTGEYIPATTWDGLEAIGGAEGWWEEAWDQEHRFEGSASPGRVARKNPLTILLRSFMAPAKMQTREDISRTVHQAMVEILTLKEAGLPLDISMNFEQTAEKDYMKAVSFRQAEDGTIAPVYLQEQLRHAVLGSLAADADGNGGDDGGYAEPTLDDSQELITERAPELEQENKDGSAEGHLQTEAQSQPLTKSEIVQGPEEIEEPFLEFTPNDDSWMQVQFEDINIKFAILKRVMQLTGVRIPDPAVEGIKNGKGLLGFLVKKPKPKKLAESLMTDETLNGLPNVKMMDRRYTPIDKEKEVGRWKVIEAELISKGLPVTGGHLPVRRF